MGEIKTAIDRFNDALELDSMHRDHLGRALALRRLGGAYKERGDFGRAVEAYQGAERILERTGDAGEKAVLYTSWGSLLEEQGRYGGALDHYERALAINQAQDNAIGVAKCLRHIGAAQLHRGDLVRASDHLLRARISWSAKAARRSPSSSPSRTGSARCISTAIACPRR